MKMNLALSSSCSLSPRPSKSNAGTASPLEIYWHGQPPPPATLSLHRGPNAPSCIALHGPLSFISLISWKYSRIVLCDCTSDSPQRGLVSNLNKHQSPNYPDPRSGVVVFVGPASKIKHGCISGCATRLFPVKHGGHFGICCVQGGGSRVNRTRDRCDSFEPVGNPRHGKPGGLTGAYLQQSPTCKE